MELHFSPNINEEQAALRKFELELFEEMHLDFSLLEIAFDWPNSYISDNPVVNHRSSINKNIQKIM